MVIFIMSELLYFLYGDNSHLIKAKTDKFFNDNQIDTSDIEFFDMEEKSIVEAVNAAMTIPFLSDKKGVVLANSSFFTTNSKSINDDDFQIKYLSNYLKNPNPTTLLVIQSPYEKLDSKKPIYKECQTYCEAIECTSPKKDDYYELVKTRISQENLSIDANALEEFINRAGENSTMLSNELDKLILYTKGKNKIDLNSVKDITTKNLENKIYTLVNAVVAKDQWSISSIYQDLMRVNTEPTSIVTLLAFKFQEVLYTHSLLKMKYKQEDIMKFFNASKGRAYYIIKNANEITESAVIQYLTELEQLDYLIKSGQIEKKIGLEMFLFKPDGIK